MLMPRVGRLDRIRSCLHLEQQIDHMFQGQIVCVGAMPTSPTNVVTHAVLGNIFQCVIQSLHPHCRKLAVFFDTRRRHDHVIGVRQSRIVDLKNEATVDDRLIFMLYRVCKSKKILFIGGVVFVVEKVLQPAGSKHTHESFFHLDVGFG